ETVTAASEAGRRLARREEARANVRAANFKITHRTVEDYRFALEVQPYVDDDAGGRNVSVSESATVETDLGSEDEAVAVPHLIHVVRDGARWLIDKDDYPDYFVPALEQNGMDSK